MEDLEKAFKLWEMFDPKCPKCGKIHKRTRVGNTSTYSVKDACTYTGPIPTVCFERGERRKEEE